MIANKGLNVGELAPGFALPATNNKLIKLSDYENRPVVLIFLRGTW